MTALYAIVATIALFVVPAYVGRMIARRQPSEPCPWRAPIRGGYTVQVDDEWMRFVLFWPAPKPSERVR